MEFSGVGNFVYKDEYNIKAKIDFNWDHTVLSKNTKLEITATSDDSLLIHKLHDLPFFPWEMTGDTLEGIQFSGEGLALNSRGELFETDEKSFGFTCNSVKHGKKDGNFDYIEFYFPNIFIGFNNFEKVEKIQSRNISLLELKYNRIVYNVTLSGLNDVVSKKKEFKTSGNDVLTLKAKVGRNDENICFNEAEELMAILSELMSFVYGDSINWIYAIGLIEGTASYNVLRDIKYSNLTVFRQLIQLEFPFQLSSFISQTFNTYVRLSDKKRDAIKRLNLGLHFSAESLTFPAPFNSLGACIEDYVQRIIPETESHYITKTERHEIESSFSEWVTENIVPKLNSVDEVDFNKSGMKQKLSALIQRNLRSRISNLLGYYGFNYEQDWVSDFVKKRNSAAHGNYVYDKDDYLIWTRMVSLLERVILKELGFNGDYIDWSEIPPANKKFS